MTPEQARLIVNRMHPLAVPPVERGRLDIEPDTQPPPCLLDRCGKWLGWACAVVAVAVFVLGCVL